MKTSLMPQRGDRFFLNRRRPHERRTTSSNWLDYTFSYKQCADHLIQAQKTRPAIDRSEVYPILFLYRHYMELEMKSIIAIGRVAELNGDSKDKVLSVLSTHDLQKLLKQCRDICQDLDLLNGQFADAFSNFAVLIDEFSAHDPGSFAFRYPIDKKLNPTLIGLGDIDLNHVELIIKRCAAFLKTMREAVAYELSGRVDYEDVSDEEEEMYAKDFFGVDEDEAEEECRED